jgi:hypothetical protein
MLDELPRVTAHQSPAAEALRRTAHWHAPPVQHQLAALDGTPAKQHREAQDCTNRGTGKCTWSMTIHP